MTIGIKSLIKNLLGVIFIVFHFYVGYLTMHMAMDCKIGLISTPLDNQYSVMWNIQYLQPGVYLIFDVHFHDISITVSHDK